MISSTNLFINKFEEIRTRFMTVKEFHFYNYYKYIYTMNYYFNNLLNYDKTEVKKIFNK